MTVLVQLSLYSNVLTVFEPSTFSINMTALTELDRVLNELPLIEPTGHLL